ncbi:pyridoxamine 5'-phosphate oxidase family protein [Parasphaerochaeta coccoides]|uniref:Pyridoxamine 5'-phosphate oxidase-related FMN-binding protein n=1 Tax=Parasphaerochaeta coccoides (strain ATCC BAA-1237 / DSM 17374 / SPN1) TaxID=760011 RepID=F4GIY0_PARC1|nr:pyridoxamine 5'-phosphate oxidase family protein [Parasphaerochaeta coccoides]AEC02748.1 pyridoxamine 5'-phosphate oxidase-related FMN-binding protein [Parasphaerochaeta coccoides DSM 17374]
MEKTCEFLKKAGTYYLATADGAQPRVRPFGTAHIFEGRLYIQTGASKKVSQEMHVNPRIEICAYTGDEWMRIEAVAVRDGRIEAQASMLDAYPMLKSMYAAGDGNSEVWYLSDATATIYSFTKGAAYTEKF